MPSLTTVCVLPFRLTQDTFLKHHVTTRQQAIMEKGIKTVKDNSCLKFFSVLCEIAGHQVTAVHKCDAIIPLINMP